MLLALTLLGPALLQPGDDSPTPVDGHGGLPLPPVAIGLTAFGILMFLLLLTWAFRSVGKRH